MDTIQPAFDLSSVPRRPLIKPWFRVRLDDEQALFQYGDSVVAFAGQAVTHLFPRLLPALDGTRDIEALRAEFGDVFEAVANALCELARRGLLSDGPALPGNVEPSVSGTLHQIASDPSRMLSPSGAWNRLERSSIALLGESAVLLALAEGLRKSGVGSVVCVRSWESAADTDVVVVAPDSDDVEALPRWNTAALASGTTWFQILPFDGDKRIVGPLYVPGQTACQRCFLRRRHSTVDYSDEFWALEATPSSFPAPAAFDLAAAGVAAALLVRWLVAADGRVPGRYYAFEPNDVIALTSHQLYRVPRCSSCGAQRKNGLPSPWSRP